jgi:3-deoxy-D-manno-octulosonate 8-phosphate phosphatase (KDO 8-P phosphatase)
MKSSKLSSDRRWCTRLKSIHCLLMDVDGVLTDGKLHFTSDGEEFKSFDVQDGHGIAMARRAGLVIGFISGRPSKATTRRAADLGIEILKQAATSKVEMVEEVKKEHRLRDEQICFIGDELVDLPVMRRVGVAVAVPNAVNEVKAAAHYVTRRSGGDGAVREVIEMILKAQGTWKKVITKYMVLAVAASVMTTSVTFANGSSNAPSGAATGYIEKFEVPERDENGNLKWKLDGDRALIRSDGLMDIFNVRAEFYTSNRVDMVFASPNCVLDRANDRAATDAPVRIERENMIVTGIGGDWDGKTSTLIVRHNVQVVLTGSNTVFGTQEGKVTMNQTIASLALVTAVTATALAADESNKVVATASSTVGSANEPTVVTSERLQVDYAHNVGTFEGNVLAVDPRITVRADKMTVFFASTNVATSVSTNSTRAVEKIIAEGAVVITTPENRRARSDHAEYTATDGKVVLTGRPQVQSVDGVVTGQRITFWRGQDKMDVESDVTDTNRTRLVIYPEEQRKKSQEQSGQTP